VNELTLRRAHLVGGSLCDIEIGGGVVVGLRPAGSAPSTGPQIDLDGQWVVPGLWDHHVHFDQWAIVRDRPDLSTARSAAQAAAAIGAELAARPAGTAVLVGAGYRDALWSDEPSTGLLDQHTGNRPVVLVSGDLHAVWLNSAALARFDVSDRRTGVLREDDAFAIQVAVSDLASEQIDELARLAALAAARRGVVGIVDFEFFDIGATWQRRIAAGNRSMRVSCSVWPSGLDAAIARGYRTGEALPGTDGLATMGPLKVIIDGSLNTRTAYCFDRYPGQVGPDAHGLLTVAPEVLAALLRKASQAGLGTAVHAIGDHANAIALDAYEQRAYEQRHTSAATPASIEHAQLIAAPDITRLARLGLIASVQPEHAVDDRDVADRYWAGRTGHAFAYRSLLDAGVTLALGSDAPVAPLDPWVTIAAAVHRTRGEREPWHPEQRITVTEALAASAHHPIAAGAVADLVVLERDPLTATADELRTLPVAATMLAGSWTYASW
jgi:predicted amidohydrolase YtcJ